MDRLASIEVLVAVADAGSLSAAARRLGMPIATVSRNLSDLETHLRTRLLTRTNRGLRPTDVGADYIERCRRILDDLGEAEQAATGAFSAPAGTLMIAAPVLFGRLHVLPVVLDFLRAFPGIDVRLTLNDRVVDLHEERIDVALRIASLPDSALIATRIGALRRVICASPDFLALHGTPAEPIGLSALPCIAFESRTSRRVWVLGDGKSAVEVPVPIRLSVSTAEAAVDAAAEGIGVTRVLSYQAADAVRDGRLRVVLRAWEPEPIPVHLLHAGDRMMPMKLRAFLDFATPRLRNRIAGLLPEG